VRQHTRVFTREPDFGSEREVDDGVPADHFAGIEIGEFYWARQRARRALLFWVIAVVTLTGVLAAVAWTLGSNLPNLL
jgi:serine/threonine-protein kinase